MNLSKTMENLRGRGFLVSHFATGEEAAQYIADQLHGRTIGSGGSMTIQKLGLLERLAQDNQVYTGATPSGRRHCPEAQEAEIYITSANAIAETGEIVNIDGRGNRISAVEYNKQKVFIVAGVNKIAPDLEQAIWRARNIAAPLNARRLNCNTPCACSEELKCFDCRSEDRICSGMSILMYRMTSVQECEVVLIDEALGF